MLLMDLPERKTYYEAMIEMDQTIAGPKKTSKDNMSMKKRSGETPDTELGADGCKGDGWRGTERGEVKEGRHLYQGHVQRLKEHKQSHKEKRRKEEERRQLMIVEMQRIRAHEKQREKKPQQRSNMEETEREVDWMRKKAQLDVETLNVAWEERGLQKMERVLVRKRKEVEHRVQWVNRKACELRAEAESLMEEKQGLKMVVQRMSETKDATKSVKLSTDQERQDLAVVIELIDYF